MDNFIQERKNMQKGQLISITIGLASPDKIKSISFGEITKSETINYRTAKPENGGLFCAKIFGPVKNNECLCGKYTKLKDKGVICEKCGVEVISSKTRRNRMGHIELAATVSHIWFLKSLPSRISLMFHMPLKIIQKVLNYDSYMVQNISSENYQYKNNKISKYDVFDYSIRNHLYDKYGKNISMSTGGEAIYHALKNMDLVTESLFMEDFLSLCKNSNTDVNKIIRRLKLFRSFIRTKNKPEWMMLKVIPVLPPDLRPLVPIEGGRFASSDLNDLYRRIINRNNRLKNLSKFPTPNIIIKNEKKLLQESVDELIDNGKTKPPVTGSNKQPLKSLADVIKGKYGRFRHNLLGKRVDYSGRSVIIVNPNLKLNQCGIPKKMALELFKPFIFNALKFNGISETIQEAEHYIADNMNTIWKMLTHITKEHPVLLNRAPTLHRMGIQAFEPLLVEGQAIKLHPLVCAAFNADFDGDQMAVHIPLTIESQLESRVLMMATNNIISPAHGKPIITPSQDMIMGLYYLTLPGKRNSFNIPIFADIVSLKQAYYNKVVFIHTNIKINIRYDYKNKNYNPLRLTYTTVGRILLFDIMPKQLEFSLIDQVMTKKTISKLIDISYSVVGIKTTVNFVNELMHLGFKYATQSGISIGIHDLTIPKTKKKLINKGINIVKKIKEQYALEEITLNKQDKQIINAWSNINEQLAEDMMKELSLDKGGNNSYKYKKFAQKNSLYIMAKSGAKGSNLQIRQLAGMRGLMMKPGGAVIKDPIIANFKEGLNIFQYFTSTHGARKGLADTALKTANAGYLTRRLVSAAQDMVISEQNCNTIKSIAVSSLIEDNSVIETLQERILGRMLAKNIIHPITGKILIKRGLIINEKLSAIIYEIGVNKINIRSPITCDSKIGVCSYCYGTDLSKKKIVNVGEAVGVIAAQSIGEPGTQLTMRTFHVGGIASGLNIKNNIRIKTKNGYAVFKSLKYITHKDGHLILISRQGMIIIFDNFDRECEKYIIPYGSKIFITNKQKIQYNQQIAKWDINNHVMISRVTGKIMYVDMINNLTITQKFNQHTNKKIIKVINFQERPTLACHMVPAIKMLDNNGNHIHAKSTGIPILYFMPENSIIMYENRSNIHAGDVIAKIPKDLPGAIDITGGLTRIANMLETRMSTSESEILAEFDGFLELKYHAINTYNAILHAINGLKILMYIPKKSFNLEAFDGEFFKKGSSIIKGRPSLHNNLRIKGANSLINTAIKEIQCIYKKHGIGINGRHIEIIMRCMLLKAKITDPGKSDFNTDDFINIFQLQDLNKIISKNKENKIIYAKTLLGLTKTTLNSQSFISAASFQETTRVLTQASLDVKKDYLIGLKENIVVGGLIPAGTGFIPTKP